MAATATLFVIITLSVIVSRIAAQALMLTGMSEESARFQARSALTGVGFTTEESESVMRHPVRRRIILTLMILGKAGVASGLASLLLSFLELEAGVDQLVRTGLLVAGLGVIWLLASSTWIERRLDAVISRALRRWTHLEIYDVHRMLHLREECAVREFMVREGDWLDGQTLAGSDLREEGVLVLGIQRRDGDYLGVPQGQAEIHDGDTLVLYGPRERLEELSRRRRDAEGSEAHADAVEEQKQREEAQERSDRRREAEEEAEEIESDE